MTDSETASNEVAVLINQKPRQNHERKRRGGFTLIELLVVIAIISILTGLLLSAVQRVRAAAARTKCANNMRQLALANHMYHDSQGRLPPGTAGRQSRFPYRFMNWHTRLLPYVEQDAMWHNARAAFAQSPIFSANPPHTGLAMPLTILSCPADDSTRTAQMTQYRFAVALTDYLGNAGNNSTSMDGVLYVNSAVRLVEIRDGTSQTLLIGERPPSPDFEFGWSYGGVGQKGTGGLDSVLGVRELNLGAYFFICPDGPYRFQQGQFQDKCSAFHFWSFHSGGANFAFADGSVRLLSYSANPIMPALASREGGETVALP